MVFKSALAYKFLSKILQEKVTNLAFLGVTTDHFAALRNKSYYYNIFTCQLFLQTLLPWVSVSSMASGGVIYKNPALRRTYSVDSLFVLLWDRDDPWHIFREAPGPSGWTATLGRSRSGVGLVDQPDEVVLVGLDKFQKLWKWESQSSTRRI